MILLVPVTKCSPPAIGSLPVPEDHRRSHLLPHPVARRLVELPPVLVALKWEGNLTSALETLLLPVIVCKR